MNIADKLLDSTVELIIKIMDWGSYGEPIFRADELPPVPARYDVRKYMKDRCSRCVFFDGYDVCNHQQHSGTIIQNSVEYCRDRKRFTRKTKSRN